MLLLRCSLLADSMSRSISFWPSTIATRSSSAWVALNSMRFIVVFPARVRPGVRRWRNGGRAARAALRYRAAEDDEVHRPGRVGQGHTRRGRARTFTGPL